MAEFKEAHGYDLAPPETWERYREIGQFITDKHGPEIYGAVGHFQPGNFQYVVQQRFRDEGGRFFDPETMKATINSEAGVRTLEGIRGDLEMMPNGVEQWGFVEVELLWTVDPLLVWPAIMLAEVWQWTPFMFLLLLAALASVDREQLEAAELDGASWWMTFRSVVLLAIMPVVVVALLIRGLDLIRIFDIVWTMTRGGPGTMTETISIYAYQMAFREFDISYSAAIAVLIIALLTAMVVAVLARVEISR